MIDINVVSRTKLLQIERLNNTLGSGIINYNEKLKNMKKKIIIKKVGLKNSSGTE